MKVRLICLSLAMLASTAAVADNVAVSINAGQPGFYGRIDVGGVPQPPRLVYSQPIVVHHDRVAAGAPPIYLRVPPGHAKHWAQHCAQYGACGQPVYFVQDNWYNNVYVPYYRGHHRAHGYAPAPVAVAAVPVYPNEPRYYSVPVRSVRAVVGPPEQRCWVERQQVATDSSANVPGAIVGAVIGGVLGHQVGGGRGRDVATAGGAVAGAAIGANVNRGPGQVYGQDVQRCTTVQNSGPPDYWDVTYDFRGVQHRVQMSGPPGPTLLVDDSGVPRG
jgi:uncharacterized protein YcfJ